MSLTHCDTLNVSETLRRRHELDLIHVYGATFLWHNMFMSYACLWRNMPTIMAQHIHVSCMSMAQHVHVSFMCIAQHIHVSFMSMAQHFYGTTCSYLVIYVYQWGSWAPPLLFWYCMPALQVATVTRNSSDRSLQAPAPGGTGFGLREFVRSYVTVTKLGFRPPPQKRNLNRFWSQGCRC